MTAKLVLHLPDHERAALEAGKRTSLYPRLKRMIEQRGGTVRSEREGELVELGHDAGVTLHCREWPEMPPHSAG